MMLLPRIAASVLLLATPAMAEIPRVIADTSVTGSLVQQVMGDLDQVRVLLPQGANPHSYQMRPSDASALQSADILVWTGPALTPWLTHAAGAVAGKATDLRLLEVEGTVLRTYDGAEGRHDDRDHEGEAEDHHHDGIDPHAWLDPDNAVHWLTAIAGALSDQDPEHARTYATNAKAAIADIVDLDAELSAQLAPLAPDHLIVFHDAYGYFTDHYGLMPAIAVSLGDATSPSAARIAEVRATIAKTRATCAFPEQGHDPKLIESLIEGSDIDMGDALAPEGGTLEQNADLYGTILRGMADTLTRCLPQD